MHKLRIIQDGPHPSNTTLYLDDFKLEGVISYNLSANVHSISTITIEFALGSDFEVLECGFIENPFFKKKREISRTDLMDLE